VRRGLSLLLAFALGLPGAGAVLAPSLAHAQGNDNAYTPPNSRIRRDRPFPTEPRSLFAPQQLNSAGRQRSLNMSDMFARCLWGRSNEKGRDFLSRSDIGLVNYSQIGMDGSRLAELYPIETCLERVARLNSTGVRLAFAPEAMRRWYVQAAYLDLYPDGPTWLVPGNTVAPRVLPLSSNDLTVLAIYEFADCIVAVDPHASDYFFRTAISSPEQRAAVQQLSPVLEECLPQGQAFELSASQLRIWVGEALWHAANNSITPAAPQPDPAQQVQGNP
jgi:hypothetical protein